MASPSSIAVTAVLRALRWKRRYATAARIERDVARCAAGQPTYAPPRRLSRRVEVAFDTRHGWPCYVLTPGREVHPVRQVYYLHGGAYVREIRSQQWTAVAELAVQVPAAVTAAMYPLAPRSTAADTVATATAIAADLLAAVGTDAVDLVGDSAGGGMALAVAQRLRDRHGVQPRRIVLLAPWLDVTMTDPAIADLDRHDAMLAPTGLVAAGRIYAGDLDTRDPRVSPLYGELAGLAPVTVYSGTYDILNADAHALLDRAEAAGADVELRELPGGQHDYPVLPTREGAAAIREIATLLRNRR